MPDSLTSRLTDEVLREARAAYEAESCRDYSEDPHALQGLIVDGNYREKRAAAASRAVIVAALGPLLAKAEAWDEEARQLKRKRQQALAGIEALYQPCSTCGHAAHRPGLCEFGLADGECPCAAAPLVSPPGEPTLSLSEEWSRMADELDTVLPDTAHTSAGPDLNKLRRIARSIRALVRTQKPVEAPPSAPPPAETQLAVCDTCGQRADIRHVTCPFIGCPGELMQSEDPPSAPPPAETR